VHGEFVIYIWNQSVISIGSPAHNQ